MASIFLNHRRPAKFLATIFKRMAHKVLNSDILWESRLGKQLKNEANAREAQERRLHQGEVMSDKVATFVKEHLNDLTVKGGVFRGMKYPFVSSRGSMLIPKLLGTYEHELDQVISKLRSNDYDWIVDVGCAEGYYAVGCALIWPKAKVYAYDVDSFARNDARRMAEINDVGNRVEFRTLFMLSDLRWLDKKGKGLLICDAEGAEEKIFLESDYLDLLRDVDLIIECHDYLIPGISQRLARILSSEKTHRIEEIDSVGDYLRPQMCLPAMLEQFPIETQIWAMAELRPSQMRWLAAFAHRELVPRTTVSTRFPLL
jgi:hypothetical protein